MNLLSKFLIGGDENWQFRRQVLFVSILFCFGIIVASLTDLISETRALSAQTNAFALLGGLVMGYIFGVVADDATARKYNPPDKVTTTITPTPEGGITNETVVEQPGGINREL